MVGQLEQSGVHDVPMDHSKKWVYLSEEGHAGMRDLLGGKGAGLAEMTRAGLPVPPAFTITTEACRTYYARGREWPEGLWPQVLAALAEIETRTGRKLGDPQNPLLVSIRSGAKFSMPGMMDTILNLGLNEETREGLARMTNNPRFAFDAHRRFLHMFGKIVLEIDEHKLTTIFEEAKRVAGARHDTDLTAEQLAGVVAAYRRLVRNETGQDFPEEPLEQLRRAIEAVFASWNNRRATDYRNFHGIPHDLGTAVNVVTMVFGNLGEDSGTGVAFTRNPATGEKELYGEYLANAQGEDVVAGIRTPLKLSELRQRNLEVYQQFEEIARRLEAHYRDVQDLEFTVERGKLYMLQTRSAKRTAAAAVKTAVDLVKEGLISKEEALHRVEPSQVNQLLLPRFDPEAKQVAVYQDRLLARGLNASPGAATGKAVFDADTAEQWAGRGEKVVLVRPETNPDDVHGMLVAAGILTARGGATSHAAVVARGLGKPCVAGCEVLRVDVEHRCFSVDGKQICEGSEISIDGSTGEVFAGAIATIAPNFAEEHDLRELLEWADGVRRLGVWANADYPRDAVRARAFGAEGIGLCRTEHMFFEADRLPLVRQMILAAGPATALKREIDRLERELTHAGSAERRAAVERNIAAARKGLEESPVAREYFGALEQLLSIQKEDFKGVLRAMAGLPVVIRLIDPPLHEFLPSYDQLALEVAELRWRLEQQHGRGAAKQKTALGQELAEKEQLLRVVAAMREQNPMLGLRGCRLGLLYPAIVEMQVRAILLAAGDLKREGVEVHPEIMIPLVGHVNELQALREQFEQIARQVQEELGERLDYKFGTMMELPRACLTADEIARYAEFFSFGTNDLTQATFGFSRDDAEGKFLLPYVERGILPTNPFQVFDWAGTGKLVEMAVRLGRQARPGLKIGVCGEHGGDPVSIAFFHEVGLDYVSCSPFRVPVARLAAAQAALAKEERDK